MNAPIVRTADEVDRAQIDRFLRRVYPTRKASFLERHGDWWYRGQQNRWVIQEGGEVVAYCAVIPTALRVAGERVDAAWWVDLVVDPDHRSRGLQRAFDEKVRAAAPLIVGFPNIVAAVIHKNHGWGVREDIEVRLLPLKPGEILRRRNVGGLHRAGLQMASIAAAPVAEWFRWRLENFEARTSRVLDEPDAGLLAEVFLEDRNASVTTTFRDADYLSWRYLDAPFSDELFVIEGGNGEEIKVVAVVRVMNREGGTVARILDLFGTLDDPDVVRDVLWLAAKESLAAGADQVTAMSSVPSISNCLRDAGFVIKSRGRFCWTSDAGNIGGLVESSMAHLVLGDSDNDEP